MPEKKYEKERKRPCAVTEVTRVTAGRGKNPILQPRDPNFGASRLCAPHLTGSLLPHRHPVTPVTPVTAHVSIAQ